MQGSVYTRAKAYVPQRLQGTVEAAVGALKEQGLQGTAKVRAAGCGVCDAVQPAVAGPPLAGLRGCGLLAGLVRVLPAGSAYCC